MIVVIIFAICVCLSPLTALRGEETVSVIDLGLVASAILSVFYLQVRTLVSTRGTFNELGLGHSVPVGGAMTNPIVRFCIVGSFILIASALVNLGNRTISDGSVLTAISPFIATFFVVTVICMILHSRAAILFIYFVIITSVGLSLFYDAAIIAGFSSFYYESRFSGLSLNPNQTAMHALSIIVTGLAVLLKIDRDQRLLRYLSVMAIFSALFFGWYTYSDAFVISLVPVSAAIALAISRKFFLTLKAAIAVGMLLTALTTVVLALAFPQQISSVLDGFLSGLQTGNQDSDREILWRHGIQAWEASPIIGNGPGGWSGISMPFQGTEAHNSYIDWLTIVGLAGFIPFALSIGTVFRLNVGRHLTSYFALLAILIFASFHFMFRLPIFWLPITLLLAEHLSTSGLSLPQRRRQSSDMVRDNRTAIQSA